MTKLSSFSVRTVLVTLAPLVLMWLLAFVAVRLVERAAGPRQLAEAGILTAIVIAGILARKLRAQAALFILALFFAWNAALLVGHLRYGVHLVNGGPVQATIGLASLFGFVGGALVNRKRPPVAA